MVVVNGLKGIVAALKARVDKIMLSNKVSVHVGFSQEYALVVHEDLERFHPTGQAKFLEQPARQLNNDGTLGKIVRESLAKGQKMSQALLLAGLRIQREAQLLTPVQTGALRASAFTRIESEG